MLFGCCEYDISPLVVELRQVAGAPLHFVLVTGLPLLVGLLVRAPLQVMVLRLRLVSVGR